MATLTIKLKQHTPIIHFQSDRTYATIRATELKPKLDKFLIDKDSTLPVNEKAALDYKVRILAKNITRPIEIEYPDIDQYTKRPRLDRKGQPKWIQFPCFFGNMGEANRQFLKKFIWSDEPVILEFFAFNKNILSAIKKHFAAFLMRTTFGTRQSKGFGSFYIDPSDDLYCSPSLRYHFSVPVSKESIESWRQLFSNIDLFYRSLRSGINAIGTKKDPQNFGRTIKYTTFYFKSMMFLYFKEKHQLQWDKRSIKEAYFGDHLLSQQKSHPDRNGPLLYESKTDHHNFLVRDLLGLSTNENWLFYNDSIEKEHPEIRRFKSPIFFKPIRNENKYDVWFDAANINPFFLNKTFSIKSRHDNALKLITPNESMFNIHDFISFAVNHNLSTHVDAIFHKTSQYETLTRIYKEISANLRGGTQ